MKRIILMCSVFIAANCSTFATKHNDIKINSKVSSVEWIGKKVTGQHNGTILIQDGTLQLHDGKLMSGHVIIDMSSIACVDLKGEWSDKLVGHLNSPDFFDTENHKTAKLVITKVAASSGGNSIVSGNLTIKGITKPIEFPATIEVKDGKLAAFAEVNVDRTLYDIKYGSGKFFEGLGDKAINDEFTIKFKIAAQ